MAFQAILDYFTTRSMATTPQEADVLPIVQSGSSLKATLGLLLSHFGRVRVTSQFDKVDVNLATVTGLSVSVAAGKTYTFQARLHMTTTVAGGFKLALAGTATATAIIAEAKVIDSAKAIALASRITALAGAVGGTSTVTETYAEITGLITVNQAGTFLVQFAQNAASGTSSILVGSTFTVEPIA